MKIGLHAGKLLVATYIIRLSAVLSRLMTWHTLTLVKMRQLLLPHWRSRVTTLLDSFIPNSILVDCILSCLKWTWVIRTSLITCTGWLRATRQYAISQQPVVWFLPRCMQCRRGLAMRILSFCPSVCLSVKRMLYDQTVERSVQIYIPYERTFSLVFWEEEWLVGDDPFYLKFWVNRLPLEQNRRFLTDNRS